MYGHRNHRGGQPAQHGQSLSQPRTYCVYRNGKCAGVNESKFHQEGNVYIKNDFPQMFRLRIKDAQVESFTKVAA